MEKKKSAIVTITSIGHFLIRFHGVPHATPRNTRK